MELLTTAPVGLLALGVLVIVVGATRRRSARRLAGAPGPDTPPAPTFDAPVPTFRVVALGVSGAGKTVFLSSMFHELNFATQRRSFHLDVDPDTRFRLSAIYQKVSDPGDREWPRGTGTSETSEYVFRCVGRDPDGVKRTVLQVSYLDFAGGLLEGRGEPAGPAFRGLMSAIEQASALLVLLDGLRLRQLLENDPKGHRHFASTLRPMAGFAQSARGPIHFVVTKWDLIQSMPALRAMDEPARLRTVVNVLMRYEYLMSLVREHSSQQVVRIIPVSSVGPDFVRLDSEGFVAKRPGGRINPTNVDAPLAAVVPDVFRQVLEALDAETRRTLAQEVRTRMRLGAGDFLAAFTGLVAGPAGALVRTVLGASPLGPVFGEAAYAMFVDWSAGTAGEAAERGQAAAGRGRAARERAEREIGVVRTIRWRVLSDFDRAVYRLEDRYPASLLSSR